MFYDSCGFGFMFTFYPLGTHFKETARERKEGGGGGVEWICDIMLLTCYSGL